MTELLYPGAAHTRFEHSLGVMDVATRAFDALASKHGSTMESIFSEVPEFREKSLELALLREGIHTFEGLILARYQMNAQVYYHRLRSLYDEYLIRYFQALPADRKCATPWQILGENDISMLYKIHCDAKDVTTEHGRWAVRLTTRQHHRLVFESGMEADAKDIKRAGALLKDIQKEFPNTELLLLTPKGSIYKLYVHGDEIDQETSSLQILNKDETWQDVTEASQILGKMSRRFRCIRILPI
jgi:HD superfamily phosphohydrolase